MTSIPESSNKNFHLITHGCQMNARDSLWLTASLIQRGFVESCLGEADIVLINTCSVREKPEQKVLSTIRRIRQERKGRIRIAVLGCVAQQLGKQLFASAPEVCLVAGGDCLDQVPDAIPTLLANPAAKLALLDFSSGYRERENVGEPLPGRSAFVNIMQGCDNFCSYCIVPFTRGRQKSRSAQAILAECRERVGQGALEITLLGQNVNVWNDSDHDFSWLLHEIAAIPGLSRLRFVTPHPADFSPQIIECFALLPSLCPALHLPLQAGSDRILSPMRRRYNQADYLRLVEQLKNARPDLVLTTDLIVGFPGESELDFQDTLTMMKECGFVSSYSFCYSDRPGTRATLMPDKIAAEIKLERLRRLQALQETLTSAWLGGRVGQEAKILISSPSVRGPEGFWQGRDLYGACVHLPLPPGDHAGALVSAKIIAAKKHCLVAEPQ